MLLRMYLFKKIFVILANFYSLIIRSDFHNFFIQSLSIKYVQCTYILKSYYNRETQHHDEFISLWCLGVLKISKCHPPKKYDNKILHVGPDDVFWHLVHLTFEIFTYEERTLLHINSLLWCSYIAHLGPLHSCSKNSIREQFYILCSRSKVHI